MQLKDLKIMSFAKKNFADVNFSVCGLELERLTLQLLLFIISMQLCSKSIFWKLNEAECFLVANIHKTQGNLKCSIYFTKPEEAFANILPQEVKKFKKDCPISQ